MKTEFPLDLIAEAASRRDSYWVRVPADVAGWLDSAGLIMEQHTSRGSIEANPLFRAGRSMFAALSEHPGIDTQEEPAAVPVDAPAVLVPALLEPLVQHIIDGVVGGLENLKPGLPGDVENNLMSDMQIDRETDALVEDQPISNTANNSVDLRLGRPGGSMPIDHQPSQGSP